jgi:hypothetical protein
VYCVILFTRQNCIDIRTAPQFFNRGEQQQQQQQYEKSAAFSFTKFSHTTTAVAESMRRLNFFRVRKGDEDEKRGSKSMRVVANISSYPAVTFFMYIFYTVFLENVAQNSPQFGMG